MDTGTSAIIVGLAMSPLGKEGAALVSHFLREVLGPSAKAVGEGIAAPLRAWAEKRVQRAAGVVAEAAVMLDDAGQRPAVVPGRVLLPLLEAASLEDDEQLRRLWVTLLANAANSGRQSDMLPAFVSILKELSPQEAMVLEAVYHEDADGEHRVGYQLDDEVSARFNPAVLRLFSGPDAKSLREVELPFRNFRVIADNLARLGLVEQRYNIAEPLGGEVIRCYAPLVLTSLGHHFIQACAVAPTKAAV